MGSGHQVLERTLAEHGVEENVALRVPHFVVVPLIVAGTDLIVSLPSRVAEASARLVKVKVHPLPIPIPSFDVSLYWHARVENDAANRWLRGAMLELFGDRPPANRRSGA
jgi:DNA-binding transcriptional LysR family regulator